MITLYIIMHHRVELVLSEICISLFWPHTMNSSHTSDLIIMTSLINEIIILGTFTCYSFITVSRSALRPTDPPIQGFRGGGLFPWGLNRPGREADHSPPSSAEVKE
jgi:hypothetical protein